MERFSTGASLREIFGVSARPPKRFASDARGSPRWKLAGSAYVAAGDALHDSGRGMPTHAHADVAVPDQHQTRLLRVAAVWQGKKEWKKFIDSGNFVWQVSVADTL